MRTERGRRDAAANAIVHLVHDGVLQIRTMAYRREALMEEAFPEADYQEQIRLIADTCDTLVPGLRRGPRDAPTEALQYTWDSRNDEQRRWLRETLASHGVDVDDFIASAGP